MNHRLSILEFVVTLALALGAVAATYHWLGLQLTTMISNTFSTIPH